MSPRSSSVEVPTPDTSEYDGRRVVTAVISKGEVTLDGAGWDPKASMAGPRKTGNSVNSQREETAIWEPRTAGGHRKLGQGHGTDSALEPSEGARPCQHPDLGLRHSSRRGLIQDDC